MIRIILVFLLFASVSFGQSFGGNVMLGSPQGEFRQNIDRLGYGFNIFGTLGNLGATNPFTVGLNIGYLVYGEESETRELWPDVPNSYFDISRTNSISNLHILFQVSPFTGSFVPYAEGLFGAAYVSTSTSVESDYTEEIVASSTNFDDFNWSYGVGGGFLVSLISGPTETTVLYLDFKVRYLFASEAEYLKEGSIEVIGNDVHYDVYKSNMDLITFHIGVVLTAF